MVALVVLAEPVLVERAQVEFLVVQVPPTAANLDQDRVEVVWPAKGQHKEVPPRANRVQAPAPPGVVNRERCPPWMVRRHFPALDPLARREARVAGPPGFPSI